jgi:hypothetical protein
MASRRISKIGTQGTAKSTYKRSKKATGVVKDYVNGEGGGTRKYVKAKRFSVPLLCIGSTAKSLQKNPSRDSRILSCSLKKCHLSLSAFTWQIIHLLGNS